MFLWQTHPQLLHACGFPGVCVCEGGRETGGLQVCILEYLSHSRHVIVSVPPPSTQPNCKSDGMAIWQQHKGPGFYDCDYGYDDGSIYFNYLMKPLAKANRCRAGTISSPLKDPSNVTIQSEISASNQKNGLFQRPLITPCTQQYLIIEWERSATTSSL